MSVKRTPRDRMRTTRDILEILGNIKSVDPHEEGLMEIYWEKINLNISMSSMIVLEQVTRIVTPGRAYSSLDLYYLLKYTTDLDAKLSEFGFGKWSWRPGLDTVGARPAFTALWKAGYSRKFCKAFFSPTAGGRPYGVKWLWQ